jgi:hypothetical protein
MSVYGGCSCSLGWIRQYIQKSCIYVLALAAGLLSMHWCSLPDLTGQISKESSRYPVAQGNFSDIWKCTRRGHPSQLASNSLTPSNFHGQRSPSPSGCSQESENWYSGRCFQKEIHRGLQSSCTIFTSAKLPGTRGLKVSCNGIFS